MRIAAQFDKLALVMAALVAFSAVPFGVRYWLSGSYAMAGLVVSFIVVVLVICGAIAYYKHVPTRAYAGGTVLGAAVIVVVVEHSGLSGLFWAYPLLIFSFLLLGPRFGFWVTVPAMVAFFAVALRAADGTELARALTTLALTWITAWALTVHVDRQRRRLEELIHEDALTGVGNRRAFTEALQRAVKDYDRLGQPASLLMFDVDHFKQINDRMGHEAGDRTLVALAHCVTDRLRGSDGLFRIGGEEFAVLLRGADSRNGFDAARRLIESIRASDTSPLGALTVSAGIATLNRGESSEHWLRRVDEAMYHAKHDGRDRMCVAAAPGASSLHEFSFVFVPDEHPFGKCG